MFHSIRTSMRYYLNSALNTLNKFTLNKTLNKFVKVPTPIELEAKPIGLGRWTIETCNKKTEYKIDMANRDHCGPCGKYPPKT